MTDTVTLETPDFDRIAGALAGFGDSTEISEPEFARRIAEQLRQVWNARGATDVAAMRAEMERVWARRDAGAAGELLDLNLDRAVKAMDR